MILRIILFIFCTGWLFNASAHAQLYLEQAKINLSVSGGEHTNGTLLIHNTSSTPMDVRVYWQDFKYKAPYDGTKEFLPAGTVPGSASQWVTFTPQTFSLAAFGQQAIDYTVTVPPQIQEGHYGVLFFEKSSTGVINHETVNLVTRIGCLFFIEPANKNKKAALQDIAVHGNEIKANFVNQGNVILLPRTTYYVMQDGGLVVFRGEANKLYVPPGASGPLTIALKKKLDPGHYTLVVNADLEDGDVLVKEINLAVDASGQITMVNSQD